MKLRKRTNGVPPVMAATVALLTTLWIQTINQLHGQTPAPLPSKFIRIEGGTVIDENHVRTARETASHSTGTPPWTNPEGFESDTFTFVRVIFQSDAGNRSRSEFGSWLGWWVDYPDADLNLSFRLQQLTSIRTDPDARVLRLTDPDLAAYPLVYLEHPGYLRLGEEEVEALRRYLKTGGTVWINDFWGAREWAGFAAQVERVLPGHQWLELTGDHPLFRCVYDLRGPLHRLRVPTLQFWNPAFDADDPISPPHHVFRGAGSEELHVRTLQDEKGHILVLAILNSDVSDGWEREGEHPDYFSRYSERIAYPLAINIVVYLMTH